MSSSSQAVYALYRIYLRQVRILPHSHLRHFFELKGRDDIEKILSFKGPTLRSRNMKTFSTAVRRVQKANNGDVVSFQHILDLAYGRKGKLKWELLEPFLDSKGPLLDPIIPGKETSRPPVISPELVALLTSSYSRTTKPLSKKDAARPRELPTRADPSSDEARIFGPFSKRREVNIRRRFFKKEVKKLLPPIHALKGDTTQQDSQARVDLLDALKTSLFAETERLVGELCKAPTRTRRERKDELLEHRSPPISTDRHPSRWVRRRYRWLLSRLPQLVYHGKGDSGIGVQISPRTFSPYQKTLVHLPEVDSTTLSWMQMPTSERKSANTDTRSNNNSSK